ncbi:hypothetical protein JXA80_13040 [bacterium]|nr:hypothetical protein [candidate division CSSED10-310 bacterium]
MKRNNQGFSCYVVMVCLAVIGAGIDGSATASWTFTEINWSPGGSGDDDSIYQIAWRPQGDYALIAAGDGIFRYNHDTGTLEYLDLGSRNARGVQWSQAGDYALITNIGQLYRYDHAATGFGPITTITDIQASGTVTFYEVVFSPDVGNPQAYITANRAGTSSSHQLTLFRYDPLGSPQVYADYSGGTTYAMSSAFGGISAAFQADGDYIVLSNKVANGYNEGIFVYDPDQSTFPKEAAGNMQWFSRTSYLGNACAVTMGRAPGQRFVLVKGNGYTQRTTQAGVPASFVNWDQPGPSPHMSLYSGDADYSYDGMMGIVVERDTSNPYHRIGTFDGVGDAVAGVDLIGLPIQRSISLLAVAWHPSTHTGLIGGQDRWLILFMYTGPTATPSATPTMTSTPTVPPITPVATDTPFPSVPATSGTGIGLMALIIGTAAATLPARRHHRS